MSLTTKQQIVDEIIYEAYGGMPSNDRAISDQFVLRKLNDYIAESAVKSAFGAYNLDGCVCADDIFRLTYPPFTLLTDAVTKVKYFILPDTPVGLPSSRSYEIYPPANRGGVQSSIFKMIGRSEVGYVRSLPAIKKVFCYVDNAQMNFIDAWGIMATFDTVNMSLITSGANDLTAFLNLPDDMISGAKMIIIPQLRAMMGISDTTPIPAADSPQPRG